ncbi:flap endonuclease-1 [Candidatus Woesearchaeota archaeon]|nr:flap endonuclease-1 [Candidatus Woesearchaeota archaeon]
MGVQITELLKPKEIRIEDLAGKIVVVDAFNMLYQFLTSIRMRDGSPLTDSSGNVTSHLQGLFNRTTALLAKNLKLVFVFDGQAPALKQQERERRKMIKQEAELRLRDAQAHEDVDAMKKYAPRTSRLTPEMIDEAKALLFGLGVPVVNAPSEGEAEAASLVKSGKAYAVVSQDTDSLLFGAPRIIRNLSISGKRKQANTLQYTTVSPELLELNTTLEQLGITHDQLIAMAMLVGTDYNVGGIKGIGPKNALKLVKKHQTDFEAMFTEVGWSQYFPIIWQEVFNTFKEIPTTTDVAFYWEQPNVEIVTNLLCTKHDFSRARVEETLNLLQIFAKQQVQKGLGDFF